MRSERRTGNYAFVQIQGIYINAVFKLVVRQMLFPRFHAAPRYTLTHSHTRRRVASSQELFSSSDFFFFLFLHPLLHPVLRRFVQHSRFTVELHCRLLIVCLRFPFCVSALQLNERLGRYMHIPRLLKLPTEQNFLRVFITQRQRDDSVLH